MKSKFGIVVLRVVAIVWKPLVSRIFKSGVSLVTLCPVAALNS